MLEGLRQWAFALVLTAFAGSLAVAASNSPNMKKYIRFACALVALAVMAAPVSSLFRGLPDIFDFEPPDAAAYGPAAEFDLRDIIIRKSEEILGQRISALVEQKTGIKPENIYIYSNINNKGADIQVGIERIIIKMPGQDSAGADLEGIRAYLAGILECEVIIEQEEGRAEHGG